MVQVILNRKLKWFVIFVSLCIFGLILPTTYKSLNNPKAHTIENVSLSEDIYFNNPSALYLRQALNEYLSDSETNKANGLGDYDKSYYKSPFIVYEENNSLAGGKQLEIIFVEKPDKMFTALVYKLATGEYELKGFGQNEKVTSEWLEKIKNEYKQYFEDSKYFY